MSRADGRERGEGRAGFIISLIIVAVAIFAGLRFVPVYVAAYDLRDFIRREAHQSSLKTDEEILRAVLAKGADLDLPMKKEHLQLSRTHAKFRIKVRFDVPIDLALFTYTYRFEQEEERPLF